MVKRYSFGDVFQTDSIPVIPKAQTGAMPYMDVCESEMSLTYQMDPEDIVYGLGANVRGINKRGWIYESKCSDESKHLEDRRSLYAAHNFIVVDGRETFGLFIDYPGILTFDVGYTELSTLRITASDWNLDVYVIEGESAVEIIRTFRKLIGRSYIAPLWAFGNGQSRWGYVNAQDVRDVVRNHRENGIPLDMVYLDIDYMERFKDFTVNKERFPDFAEFVQEMKDQHIRLVPIIDAAVKEEKGYSVYDEGIEKGYFCTGADGKPFVGAVWPGRSLFTDMLNKEARDWFGDQYKVLLDQGIEGGKTLEDWIGIAQAFEKKGLVALHMRNGSYDAGEFNSDSMTHSYMREGLSSQPNVDKVKPHVNIPILSDGSFRKPERVIRRPGF